MRITGGVLGGLTLKTPKSYDVRPTPDMVRQAVFNSLGERVLETRVLELFGGTGALSLECLSRGARQAVCVEISRPQARMIEHNFGLTNLARNVLQIRIQDVFTAIPQLAGLGETYNLILADPPYGEKNVGRRSTSMAQRLLDSPDLPRLLAPEGIFILGHSKRDTLEIAATWKELKTIQHGDSMMRFIGVA